MPKQIPRVSFFFYIKYFGLILLDNNELREEGMNVQEKKKLSKIQSLVSEKITIRVCTCTRDSGVRHLNGYGICVKCNRPKYRIK
jgi:hypothetical protein